jgi:hypothetical protein
MPIEANLRRALDALDEYQAEGVVLETAVQELLGQRATLEAILAPLDARVDRARLGDVFVALENHLRHVSQLLEVAVDFLAEAAQVAGKPPAETDPAHDPRIGLAAEEDPI